MDKKKLAINILSAIGLILSIELCVVFINANFIENATPSICAINSSFDCDKVAKSPFSQFLGVPLSLWGVILYLFFLIMNNVEKLQTKRFLGFLQVFKNPYSYMHCIGIFAFICSMFLALISELLIHSICIFCLVTYFINLIIALVAKQWGAGFLFEIKNSFKDFFAAMKQTKYAIAFIIVVYLATNALIYLNDTKILTPNVWYQSKYAKKEARREVDGNILGNKNASLVIHEYIDFNCGGCFFANLYLHRIANEFENVRVVQHSLPLEQECNHNMKFEGHKGSCLKSRYALAAAKQNKYWIMSTLLFFEKEMNSEDNILKVAKKRHFDLKKLREDANSEEIKEELKQSILEADAKNIKVTPTIFIGMKKLEGVGPYQELEKIVIEQGGIKKSQ